MVFFKKRDLIKVKVFHFGDHYEAMARTKDCTVWHCYGSTRESAKEMALFRLKKALEEEPREKELVLKGEHYAIYRDK